MEPRKLLDPTCSLEAGTSLPVAFQPLHSVIWGLQRLLGVLDLGSEQSLHFPLSLRMKSCEPESIRQMKEPLNFLGWDVRIPRKGISALTWGVYFSHCASFSLTPGNFSLHLFYHRPFLYAFANICITFLRWVLPSR